MSVHPIIIIIQDVLGRTYTCTGVNELSMLDRMRANNSAQFAEKIVASFGVEYRRGKNQSGITLVKDNGFFEKLVEYGARCMEISLQRLRRDINSDERNVTQSYSHLRNSKSFIALIATTLWSWQKLYRPVPSRPRGLWRARQLDAAARTKRE